MVSRYDILGRRVRSTPKPIVARTAPSRERPTVHDWAKSGIGECISSCVASQRKCHTDAREAYHAAAEECRDNHRGCITTCKKSVFLIKEE